MANTKAIGVAFEDQNIIGADNIYSAGEIGYGTGAQGTVTQATSKSTGVTLNKSAGQITLNNASLAATTTVTFTLTNSFLSSNDIVILSIASGGTAGAYNAYVSGLAAGSVVLALRNVTAGALAEAVVVNFAIIHCT